MRALRGLMGPLLAVAVLVLQPAGSLELQCQVPLIAHGRLRPVHNFTSGGAAMVECDAGYVPAGTGTVRCLSSGRWQPRVPACVPGRCPSPPALSYADRSPQREFLVGSTVTYFCRNGYTMIPEVSPTITCLKNFTWSSIPTLCQMVQCPNPTISHGQEINVKDAKYTFGRQAAFQCDPGYVLWGSRRAQCGSDGTWSPPVPFCDKVCDPPPQITSGQHTASRSDLFPYGYEVKYSCAAGLSLIGDESIYCTSTDGENLGWSGSAPECRVVRCPRPDVEHGRMAPPRHTFPYGVSVRFSCDEGFVLRGDAETWCAANSTWQPPLPSCVPVQCPEPQVVNGRLKNARDSKTRYPANTTVTFECLHGYHFSGGGPAAFGDTGTATCLADGKWTPLPKCKKQGEADICEEVGDIKAAFECGVPMEEVRTLLEVQKLFLEIQKLKVELGLSNKVIL
ncbi:membrane cofactor protein-like [Anas acuta]|uniref:membrane cofactor protein-like n=1 Tax=Anas acuta TaxID=28680 RepID=UPI0035C8869A